MPTTETWWDRTVLPWLVEKACRSTTVLQERKRWVPQASGEVLEIGVGSGLNLAFYDPNQVERVVGVDVSAPLLERAAERLGSARVPVELKHASAEELPFAERTFDTTLVTYSLCSVPNVLRALHEVRRVMKPEGRLIFVEHGRSSDPRIERWQTRLTPLWRRAGGGCHLDRDIRALIEGSGFRFEVLERGETDATLRVTSFGYQGIARIA